MKKFHKLAPFAIPAYYVILLPFVGCSSHEDVNQSNQSSIGFNKVNQFLLLLLPLYLLESFKKDFINQQQTKFVMLFMY
jgi:hypothetical protein